MARMKSKPPSPDRSSEGIEFVLTLLLSRIRPEVDNASREYVESTKRDFIELVKHDDEDPMDSTKVQATPQLPKVISNAPQTPTKVKTTSLNRGKISKVSRTPPAPVTLSNQIQTQQGGTNTSGAEVAKSLSAQEVASYVLGGVKDGTYTAAEEAWVSSRKPNGTQKTQDEITAELKKLDSHVKGRKVREWAREQKAKA